MAKTVGQLPSFYCSVTLSTPDFLSLPIKFRLVRPLKWLLRRPRKPQFQPQPFSSTNFYRICSLDGKFGFWYFCRFFCHLKLLFGSFCPFLALFLGGYQIFDIFLHSRSAQRIFSDMICKHKPGYFVSKLFWPTVRKNVLVIEKKLKAENLQKFWSLNFENRILFYWMLLHWNF